MDNRFGFKDLVQVVLLVILIVSVWLTNAQYDRQWGQLREINNAIDSQNDQLRRLNQQLQQGVALRDHAAGGAQTQAADGGADADTQPGDVPPKQRDPFYRIEQARAQDDFAEGDRFIDVFGQTVGTLTPLVSKDVYASVVSNFVLQSLAERDPDTLEWYPRIARSWTVNENEEGVTITFELRRDVRFSDGEPLTAEDVVFTYDWTMNPKVDAVRARSYYRRIKDVTREGEYTVTFKYDEPYFKAFELAAGMDILAEHYYSEFTPKQFNQTPGLLFGSGPYQLPMEPRNWEPGSGQITLVRNEDYWGVRPGFSRIVFREILDDTARLTTFRNGDIDQYSPTPEQYGKLKQDESLRERAKLYEYETMTGGYRYIGWNQQRGGEPTLFADQRVRQAMTLLLDRQRMCDRLMAGLATVSTGPFHRLGEQVAPDVEPWPHAPQRARSLLREAGFEDRDGDGVIENDAGDPFQFSLIYPADSTNYQQMAKYLKDAYARAGIDMQLEPLEWNTMIQRMDQRDFDAMTLGWSGSVEGDPYQIFHSSQIEGGGDNYVNYRNKELDQLIEDARRTLDKDERMQLWHEVHRIIHEDQPYTFLFTQKAVQFMDRRIHNVEITRTGLNQPIEWYVPTPQQKWSN